MADRILKPDSGNDLVLQNDDGSGKIEINENASIPVTGTLDVSGATLTTSSAQKTAIVDGGKGNLTKSDVGLGNVTNDAQVPASGGTFSGNVSFGDNNITNVGDIALDTISSDAGTSIGVTLGTDAGDDFNVGSGKLVVEGDTGNIGIGSDSPAAPLHVNNSGSSACRLYLQNTGNTAAGSTQIFSQNDDLAFNAGNSERMRIDSSGNLKFDSGYGSVGTAYGCRAWVNFNGTGTVAIRGSGNVSSITDNGTGDYTVNFSTNMPDANYAISGISQYQNNNGQTFMEGPSDASTTSVRVYNKNSANSVLDAVFLCVQVFR